MTQKIARMATLVSRLLLYGFSSVLSLILLLLIVLSGWLFFTTLGGQWLFQQIPGLSVQGFQGQLIGQWQAKAVQWQSPSLNLAIDDVVFDWQPRCLLKREVCLTNLHLGLVQVDTPAQSPAPASALPIDWSSLRLPVIELPELDLLELAYLHGITIEKLSLGQLEMNGEPQLSHLKLAANWQAKRISLHELQVQSPFLPGNEGSQVTLKGWLATEENWPLALSLSSEFSDAPLNLALTGDFSKLNLNASLALLSQKEAALRLTGWVNLLQPAAPLSLNLTWQNLDPPKLHSLLASWPSNLKLDQGKLSLKGDLAKGWQLKLDTEQQLNALPVSLSLASNLSWQTLQLTHLKLSQGEENWLNLELELAQMAKQHFKLQGKVNGQIVAGLPKPLQLDSEFKGFLNNRYLKKQSVDYALQLTQFNLTVDQDQVGLALDLNPASWQAALNVDVVDLAKLSQNLLKLANRLLPEVITTADLNRLLKSDALVGDIQLNTAANVSPIMQLKADATNPNALTGHVLQAKALEQALGQGSYQLAWVTNQLAYASVALEGVDLKFAYTGQENYQDPALSLDFTGLKLTQEDPLAPSKAPLVLKKLQLHLSGLLSQHQLTSGLVIDDQPLIFTIQGGVQLESLENLQWDYQLAALNTELLMPWLPEGLRWLDQVGGKIKGHWKNQQLKASLDLKGGPGELAVKVEDTLNNTFAWVPLNYQQFNVGLSIQDQQLTTRLTLNGEQLGNLSTELAIALEPNASNQQRAIQGNYQLEGLQLQLLSPFIELDKLVGQLAGQGEIRGHLLAPEVWGNLQLQGIAAADSQWPVSLERLEGELVLQGEKMRLKADFATGEGGEGQLTGDVRWQPELMAKVQLKGEAFQVRVEPFASLQVTPNLTFSYQKEQLLLAGQVKIPSGVISVQQLPKQAIKVSEDAEVVGRTVVDGKESNVNLDIELLLGNASQPEGPPLSLDAMGLVAEIQGRLKIANGMQTRGELLLVKGTYQSWGQDLKLRKARLNFAGPVSLPSLDIEAVREVKEVTVGIHLTARVDKPETAIFSEPDMANEQALSWLILGRPLRTEKDENSLNAAAISFGLKQASGITGRLGETVGLKDFQLMAEGGGSETSVVASGYINDRLSVSYGVGIYDEVSRFVVRYDLTRQVYVEAASSLASSLDIFWRLEF